MFASGLIEAVVISTGNKTHYDMTMKALEAGLHVLCEKPLAMTVTEANEMAAKAQETGLKMPRTLHLPFYAHGPLC